LRAPAKKSVRAASAILTAKLLSHVTLETRANGDIVASFHGYSLPLGKFSAGAAARAQELRTGLPPGSFASTGRHLDKEVDQLVRRLAIRGLLEYVLTRSRRGGDLVVIEPQAADYWPQISALRETDTVVLSRFAYMRRRASDLVLESPRSRALFKIGDPKIAGVLALLSTPRQISKLRRQTGFPGLELLGLLVDCQILFKVGAADAGLRPTEGDENLVLWDFHDLLFHTRSTEGRHANPAGGVYAFADAIPSPPAVRTSWPGKKIDLRPLSAAPVEAAVPTAKLLRRRHSTRDFDAERPITLAELARFLDGAARTLGTFNSTAGGDGPPFTYALRPYPSGGSSHELELYLAVDTCEGLARGFYHYDAGEHALVALDVTMPEFEALLQGGQFAMDASGLPQILITIAARFGRVAWKYSSIAYSLILKDTGVLMQTLYLMATDMGLGGCAIGSNHIELFAKLTGLEFHVEGPVGLFALGRGKATTASG
jgi:SagB-type dehydrogenase family enzyme